MIPEGTPRKTHYPKSLEVLTPGRVIGVFFLVRIIRRVLRVEVCSVKTHKLPVRSIPGYWVAVGCSGGYLRVGVALDRRHPRRNDIPTVKLKKQSTGNSKESAIRQQREEHGPRCQPEVVGQVYPTPGSS